MVHDVHARAVVLAKEADGRREELVRARRIPSDLFQRCAETGLFRQMLARQLGGLGRSPAEWFETGVEMALVAFLGAASVRYFTPHRPARPQRHDAGR